jgi:hypothetical protein
LLVAVSSWIPHSRREDGDLRELGGSGRGTNMISRVRVPEKLAENGEAYEKGVYSAPTASQLGHIWACVEGDGKVG